MRQNEGRVPRAAVMKAIDAGVSKAAPRQARRVRVTRGLAIAAAALLVVGGATTVAAGINRLNDTNGQTLPNSGNYWQGTGFSPSQAGNRQAKAWTMKPGITYLSGPTKAVNTQQVAPGLYDVTATKGDIDYMGTLIPEGATYPGIWYFADNAQYGLAPGTEARLTPAKFAKMPVHGKTYTTTSPFGAYNVGTQIPAGYYRLHIETTRPKYHVLVNHDVQSDSGNDNVGITVELFDTDKQDKAIQLAANNPLMIFETGSKTQKVASPAGSITLQLTKISLAEAKRLGFDATH
ncbi:hypothetical protein [Lacticaseibacillus kribbianus]|uniref:hypothetical protein n=1 Tax=Lacticaseibacillus kribbianus TaxID=2926292 RepID=UPI001CD2A8B1|nr:hypothetical protein [Lacticaseibacillus kribbianus]